MTVDVDEVEDGINGEYEDITEKEDCAIPEERKQVENDEDRDAAALQEDAAIAMAMVKDLSLDSPTADVARSHQTPYGAQADDPSSEPLGMEDAMADGVSDDARLSTPIAPPSGRMQSADPHKSSRLSRTHASLSPNIDETTGDESSLSTADVTRVTRKKRSHSTD